MDEQIRDILRSVIEPDEIAADTEELALYIQERANHLAEIQDEPGIEEAVEAERDAVLLRAGLKVNAQAGTIDARISQAVGALLRILLVAIVP